MKPARSSGQLFDMKWVKLSSMRVGSGSSASSSTKKSSKRGRTKTVSVTTVAIDIRKTMAG